ncbi:hypothetical protein AAD018_005065 [Aestuariibius insulae]|uniref:hypothetical protein n=1 Tax=Aestuariibius insulae TaxID=2058287 RepID=UPI00345E744E
MVALSKQQIDWSWPDAVPSDRSADAFLNHVRFVALGCRAKARTDLFEACALLSLDRHSSFRAHAEALILCLSDALGQRAILFRPGTREHSFDEAWLLRLAAALAQSDEDSAAFLLRSRLPREHHRHIRFLVTRISLPFALT